MSIYTIASSVHAEDALYTACKLCMYSLQHRCSKQEASSKILTADRKMLFALCYFLLFCIVSNTFSSLGVKPDNEFAANVYKYFQCESKGRSSCDAEKTAYESLTFPLTSMIYHLLYGTIPLIILVITTPTDKITQLFKSRVICCCKRRSLSAIFKN